MYRNPSPVPRFNEILETLQLCAAGTELSEFELRRIERDARALMRKDAGFAHTVLGAVAALRGNSEEARQHHDIALKRSGWSATAYQNYSVSLTLLGELTEAFKLEIEAYQRYPGDKELLRQVVGTALESTHFREGLELCAQWNESVPGHPLPYEPLLKTLTTAVERQAFDEELIREVLEIARGVLRESHVRTLSGAILADHTDSDSFLYEIHIAASPKMAAELNLSFADRIVAREDLMVNPGMKFVPVFIGAGLDAGFS